MKKRTKRHYQRAMAIRKEVTTRGTRSLHGRIRKQSDMCEKCLVGRHPLCTSAECSCVHREGDVPK
jgi:hypothetical protein